MAAAATGEATTSSWSKWTPTLKGVEKLQAEAWAVAVEEADQKLPHTLEQWKVVQIGQIAVDKVYKGA